MVVTATTYSSPFQRGTSAQPIAGEHARRSRRNARPAPIGVGPCSATPSTLTVAVHIRSGVDLQHAVPRRSRTVDASAPTVAPGGRSAGNRPALTRRRQVEEPGREVGRSSYDRVMIAEHAGSGERQSARRSHACGARPASFANGRAGSNRTHQPSCTNSSAAQIRHATSARMQARARAGCAGTADGNTTARAGDRR